MTDISQPKRDCVYFYEKSVGGAIVEYCMHYAKRNHAPCPEDCDCYLKNEYKKGVRDGILGVYKNTHFDVLESLHIYAAFDDYCKHCKRAKPILKEDNEIIYTFEGPQTIVNDRYIICEKAEECRKTIEWYNRYLEEKESLKEKENE